MSNSGNTRQQKHITMKMKVVIQNRMNRTYLKSLTQWTDEPHEAKNFGYFERAAQFVRQKHLQGVQFAVPLSESNEVLVFPML